MNSDFLSVQVGDKAAQNACLTY